MKQKECHMTRRTWVEQEVLQHEDGVEDHAYDAQTQLPRIAVRSVPVICNTHNCYFLHMAEIHYF